MPVTGTDAALASKLQSDILAKVSTVMGKDLASNPLLSQICQAIAETIINHFVQNVKLVVAAGIPVSGGAETTAAGTGTIT